jgi:hypothetical protein
LKLNFEDDENLSNLEESDGSVIYEVQEEVKEEEVKE